eukprot:TRINITY_DN73498_c0_g1_i1.p1 TRINITY_DN73498_c0_g1~~TRINITY_DN73498_c0_g1_i1.p1  ORF type:complete len:430 (-),score=77.94 TRINITY_DN73498_c0_g1_i1:46-1248(-)
MGNSACLASSACTCVEHDVALGALSSVENELNLLKDAKGDVGLLPATANDDDTASTAAPADQSSEGSLSERGGGSSSLRTAASSASLCEDAASGALFCPGATATVEELPELEPSEDGEAKCCRAPVLTSETDALLASVAPEAVEELRARLSRSGLELPDVLREDLTLRRFLLARKGNLAAAEAMIARSLEWRAKVGADDIARDVVPHFPEGCLYCVPASRSDPDGFRNGPCYPSCIHGKDKDGCPIYLDQIGACDLDELFSHSIDELLRYHVRTHELLSQLVERAGHFRYTAIIDLAGTSMSYLFHRKLMAMLRASAKLDEGNYPETVRRVLIVNAPDVVAVGFKWLSPLLAEDVRNNLRIVDVPSTPSVLREFVDADQLPASLGGTCVCRGGCVPTAAQ